MNAAICIGKPKKMRESQNRVIYANDQVQPKQPKKLLMFKINNKTMLIGQQEIK